MGGGRWGPTSIFIQGAHNSLAMALEDCTGFHSCQARTDLSYSWHRFTETIQLKIGKKEQAIFTKLSSVSLDFHMYSLCLHGFPSIPNNIPGDGLATLNCL